MDEKRACRVVINLILLLTGVIVTSSIVVTTLLVGDTQYLLEFLVPIIIGLISAGMLSINLKGDNQQ